MTFKGNAFARAISLFIIKLLIKQIAPFSVNDTLLLPLICNVLAGRAIAISVRSEHRGCLIGNSTVHTKEAHDLSFNPH